MDKVDRVVSDYEAGAGGGSGSEFLKPRRSV